PARRRYAPRRVRSASARAPARPVRGEAGPSSKGAFLRRRAGQDTRGAHRAIILGNSRHDPAELTQRLAHLHTRRVDRELTDAALVRARSLLEHAAGLLDLTEPLEVAKQ